MIVTTAGKSDDKKSEHAKSIAATYNLHYIERKKQTIEALKTQYQQDIIIVGREKIAISPRHSETPLHFHPNFAMVRAKRILAGEEDPLIRAARLKEGMTLLDCTMGLAADSIIASLVANKTGTVTAVEASPLLHLLVTEGLKIFPAGDVRIQQAMRNIETILAHHNDHLKTLPDNSYDIVYFDPMFQETIDASHAIQQIHTQTIKADLTEDTLKEAKRVAAGRVVLKDHWKSRRFEAHGFHQIKRKTSLFHYGFIESGD